MTGSVISIEAYTYYCFRITWILSYYINTINEEIQVLKKNIVYNLKEMSRDKPLEHFLNEPLETKKYEQYIQGVSKVTTHRENK